MKIKKCMFQYVDRPPVKSKQNPVLKDASLETMNFVVEATSSSVQHLVTR